MAYRSDFLDVRGVRTHMLKGGRGKPLLVLHPEFAANAWAPYHDALASHFQVLAPDHPGFGDSERPEWLDGIDDLVFHYLDVLDLLSIERLSIVGTSVGGWIAAAFAVAHPERVERLVLAAPAGIKVDGVPRYDIFANPFETTLQHLFHDPARAAQILPTEYGADVIVRVYHELTTLARLAWNPYLYDPKLQQRLPRLQIPTLLVWGERDTMLPPAHGEAFAALLPSAALKVLPACGHLVPLECGDEFARLTAEFLRGEGEGVAMQFFYFHLMPWPYLPRDFDRAYQSAWVTLPNRLYDPKRGQHLYNEYLDELEHAERLGFDGLCVNEHHQNAYGTMPSPNLMAAALARRTSRAKLAILGNAIGLRDHPLRVAEEIAMLDVMSGGRVISGFVRGIGCEHLSLGVNPTYSRERFYEAHDLILRAWTEPGPFDFEGKHYRVRYANIWPRPLQQPHPPIWLPSQGSPETIRFGARHRYPFVSVFTPYANTRRLINEYKEEAERLGYRATPEQLGFAVVTYVAPTDAQARREAKPHVLWLFKRGLKIPPHFLAPPGYLSEDTLRRFLLAGVRPPGELSFEELEREGYVLVGSPRTVRDRLEEIRADLGIGVFVGGGRIGDMPHGKALRSAELFARQVMPHFRPRAARRLARAPQAKGKRR